MAGVRGVSPADFERFARAIYEFYAEAEAVMFEIVRRRLERGIDRPGWAEAKLAEIQVLRRDIQRVLEHLARGDLEAARAVYLAYEAGVKAADIDLDRFMVEAAGAAVEAGVAAGAAWEPVVRVMPQVNRERVEVLARKLVDGLAATRLRILRDTEEMFRQAVEAGERISYFIGAPSDVAREAVARAVGAGTVAGVRTRVQTMQDVLRRFADRGITGFVDRAGRRWDLASYAETAVRSATGQAGVQGHIDRLVERGHQLVVVSDSPEECDVCRPWENVVLALTPEAARQYGVRTLEEARDAGLFHPNCTHRLGMYVEGLTYGHRWEPRENPPDNPRYEERQQQRYIERQIRKWKRRAAVALTEEERRACERKVREWQARMRAFIAETDRRRRYDREQVYVNGVKLPPVPRADD